MSTDVTDETFESAVLDRSVERPVVVDLWAPWCGPCRTLGPILEQVIDGTEGSVELVKVNVDDNPAVAAAFRVQSIPAVFALRDRQVVDGFVGAIPEDAVRQFVGRLVDQPSEIDQLVEAGDESSLRQALELQADHPGAITALAELLVEKGENEEALALVARVPESAETRRIAALARLSSSGDAPADDGLEARLLALLDKVKDDEQARQAYLDLLEAMDLEDPRRGQFRRALSSRLF